MVRASHPGPRRVQRLPDPGVATGRERPLAPVPRRRLGKHDPPGRSSRILDSANPAHVGLRLVQGTTSVAQSGLGSPCRRDGLASQRPDPLAHLQEGVPSVHTSTNQPHTACSGRDRPSGHRPGRMRVHAARNARYLTAYLAWSTRGSRLRRYPAYLRCASPTCWITHAASPTQSRAGERAIAYPRDWVQLGSSLGLAVSVALCIPARVGHRPATDRVVEARPALRFSHFLSFFPFPSLSLRSRPSARRKDPTLDGTGQGV